MAKDNDIIVEVTCMKPDATAILQAFSVPPDWSVQEVLEYGLFDVDGFQVSDFERACPLSAGVYPGMRITLSLPLRQDPKQVRREQLQADNR